MAVLKYSPDQPRVPAGSPEGGQFAGAEGGDAAGTVADARPAGGQTPGDAAGHPVGFDDVADADRWGAKEFGGWEASLAKEERWAVEAYSGGGYENVNGYLRGKHAADLADAPGKTAQVVKGLDSALAKGKAPSDLTVYRGVRGDQGDKDSFVKAVVAAAQAGGTLTDSSFTSSSMARRVADEFAGNTGAAGRESAVVKINVPKGSPGAYTDVLEVTGEGEWLMPRGTTLRLHSPVRRPDGVWEVQASVHPGAVA